MSEPERVEGEWRGVSILGERLPIRHQRFTLTTPVICQDCGAEMKEGYTFADASGGLHDVFDHRVVCEAAEKAEEARSREAMMEALRASRLTESGVGPGPSMRGYRDQFPTACGAGGSHAEAFNTAGRFLGYCRENKRPPQSGFMLIGQIGSGKTSFAAAFCRSLLRLDFAPVPADPPGVSVLWRDAPTLRKQLLPGKGDAREALMERLVGVPVLFLDDLGRETISDWWLQQDLFPLINERYRRGLPIIATSNYSLKALTVRYGAVESDQSAIGAIADRLRHRCGPIEIGGGSHRDTIWDF